MDVPVSPGRLDLADAGWPPELPRPLRAARVGGGWVATTWRAELADGADVAVKVSPHDAGGEIDGLRALAAAGVPVPEVLGHAGRTIVQRWATGPADWAGLGRAVAGMHSATAGRFGWHRDNHAGGFVQPNGWLDHWPTFFVERRVRIHLADPAVPADLRTRIERACDGALPAMLPERPPACLTHGDLWWGNVVAGRWVIDPEVSFADRELDLAYMEMPAQRPLPRAFWAAYTELLPLPSGYPRRRRALQLHHALLSVRHFGERAVPSLASLLDDCGW